MMVLKMEYLIEFVQPSKKELEEILDIRMKMGRLDDKVRFRNFLEKSNVIVRVIKVNNNFAGYFIVNIWKPMYGSIYEMSFLNRYFNEDVYKSAMVHVVDLLKEKGCKYVSIILQYDEKYQFEVLQNIGFEIENEIFRYEKTDFSLFPRENKNVLVMPAAECDIEKILEIDRHCFSESEQLNQNILKETLHHSRGESFLIVARLNYNIVGFAWCSIFSQKRIGYIVRIAVHPKYHGMGIGTRLLNSCITWLKEQGASKIFLRVISKNIAAQRFFEKFGFRRVGIEYMLVKKLAI